MKGNEKIIWGAISVLTLVGGLANLSPDFMKQVVAFNGALPMVAGAATLLTGIFVFLKVISPSK
jgi:hypothetical protein